MNILGPPIEFPDIPYVNEIPGGVRVGLLIRIQGKIPKRAHRFAINVGSGIQISEPLSEIGFHFNPRFDHGYVARNSLFGDGWGEEENESPSNLPFAKGRTFEIMIMVERQHYKVAVDGLHFLKYDHRVPMETLRLIHIQGDVKIYKLEFLDTQPQPSYGFQPVLAPPMNLGLVEPVEIFNPIIPLVNEIPGGNRVGLQIRINGKIPKHATEFIINFACGPQILEPRSDIGFHFNARFDCGYVARNSLIEECWGAEESDEPDDLPFTRRQEFDIIISAESSHYKVSVDGRHFLRFNHRIPIEMLNTLQIIGDIEIFKLEFLNFQPEYGFQAPPPMAIVQPREILNPAVPFRQVLPNGMQPGTSIFVTGRPKPYATRFSINLEKTREIEPDIVFHFNPRFGGMGDEKESVVVRSDFRDGRWGFEERDRTAFPFVHGFNFDLTILCEPEFYLVAVNGQHLLSFRHRMAPQNVDTLYVVGDVDIMLLRF